MKQKLLIRIFNAAAMYVLSSVVCGPLFSQTKPNLDEPVRKILERSCLACHGSAQMSALDLRVREGMLKGGKRGPALVPGDAERSLLYQAVTGSGELKMPPGKEPLAAADIEAIRDWIRAGAPWGTEPSRVSQPSWCAFRTPSRPAVPQVKNESWVRNPIDAFVLSNLEEKKLSPAAPAEFGTQCLLARRMVERGVRFVQLYSGGKKGSEQGWDGHNECDQNHSTMARKVDRPIAGLLADLKGRGLLESTLVIWGGDFSRTPFTDGDAMGAGNRNGRDHNPYGFTAWMAGGGIRAGKIIGATDEIGLHAAQDKVHVHDLHATILTLLGLDHKKLTYLFQGRDFRLTDVGGNNDLAHRLIGADAPQPEIRRKARGKTKT